MTPAPKRRWFAFSLRMMFVVVTILGFAMSWVVYQLNWIRERHAFRENHFWISVVSGWDPEVQAPGLLWLFGEDGVYQFSLIFADATPGRPKSLNMSEKKTLENAKKLFPEAIIPGAVVWPIDLQMPNQ
jgi:hypothetical protein